MLMKEHKCCTHLSVELKVYEKVLNRVTIGISSRRSVFSKRHHSVKNQKRADNVRYSLIRYSFLPHSPSSYSVIVKVALRYIYVCECEYICIVAVSQITIYCEWVKRSMQFSVQSAHNCQFAFFHVWLQMLGSRIYKRDCIFSLRLLFLFISLHHHTTLTLSRVCEKRRRTVFYTQKNQIYWFIFEERRFAHTYKRLVSHTARFLSEVEAQSTNYHVMLFYRSRTCWLSNTQFSSDFVQKNELCYVIETRSFQVACVYTYTMYRARIFSEEIPNDSQSVYKAPLIDESQLIYTIVFICVSLYCLVLCSRKTA